MSNIEDIRAQLRAEGGGPRGSGLMSVLATALAAVGIAAVGSGFVYFLFLKPVVAPMRPNAAIPTFQRVGPDGQRVASPFAPQPGDVRPPSAAATAAKYAGLSFRQTGKAADETCFARAHAKFPHWSKTPRLTTKSLDEFHIDDMPHFNELMACLLTEAPTRYCSTSQRSMIANEIRMYFLVLDDGNRGLAKLRANMEARVRSGKLDREFAMEPEERNRINRLEFAVDQRVVAGIEARIADGTLTKAERDSFGAAVPPAIRQRFTNTKPSTPGCPRQRWWAFWRTL